MLSRRVSLFVLVAVALLPTVLISDTAIAQAQEGLVACSGPDCQFCSVIETINNVTRFIIGIVVALATLMLAYTGFQLVVSQGNPETLQRAKEMFTNTVIGIVIILAAFTLVDTVLKIFVSDEFFAGYGPWNEIECAEGMFAPGDAQDIDIDLDNLYQYEREGGQVTFYTTTVVTRSDGTTETQRTPAYTGSISSGNSGIVQFAEEMRQKGCVYNQPLRNGCIGNPGYTDCSDLVHFAYRAAGCRSPGTYTGNQISSARSYSSGQKSTLQPGDALIRRSGGKGHIVICVDSGCDQVIHAKGTGYDIVRGNGSYYTTNYRDVIRAADFCS